MARRPTHCVREEVRFAGDSPLEQRGFELAVPPRPARGATTFELHPGARTRRTPLSWSPESRSFASASDLRHGWSAFHIDKVGLAFEIGFGDFEHHARHPASPPKSPRPERLLTAAEAGRARGVPRRHPALSAIQRLE